MFKKFVVCVLPLTLCSTAFAEKYEIDSAHASAGFTVKHLMVSNVRGEFSDVKGTVVYDEAHPEKSSVDATIAVSTIDTRQTKRDDHLKSPDFFDAQKFPVMTYKSRKVEKVSDGHLKVIGDLTLHGVTKEVALDVEGPTGEVKDPWGNVKRGASATAKLSRKDFGLTWNKALETGGVVVGDEVAIHIDLELQKAPDAVAKN